MPASSKAQQRFFGVVKSMQKGDKPKEGEAGKIAKQMSKKDVDKYASTKHKGKPEKVKREMKVRELIKKMVREELANLEEVAKRDYKAEYKKFQSSTKSKKYRAELNKYNRQKGTYGNGDGKDASHKGGKIVGFEKESVNRGRAEKSRLKKEEKLKEVRIPFSSSHIKQLKRAFKDMKGTLPDNNPLVQKIVQLLKSQDKKVLQQLANADIKYLSDKAKDILGEGKLNERLHVVDERYVGKYIIWVLQDGNKIRTAVLGKKGFDNFSSNDPDDLKKLWNLTKKFKGKPIPDIATEGTCGYGENGELGEEPAGPHLIKKKKMKEEVEPIGGMAKIAKIVKDKQHAKVGGQTVDMQSANLLMKLYNAVKDKDKEKMNKMSEKKLIMVLGKLWSRVKLKLPT